MVIDKKVIQDKSILQNILLALNKIFQCILHKKHRGFRINKRNYKKL